MSRKIKIEVERIIQQTGIDFSKYKKPELVDKVLDLVAFPIYAARSLVLPFVILFSLNAAGAALLFYLGTKTVTVIILAVLGAVGSAVVGAPLGARYLISRVVGDVSAVMDMNLDLAQTVLKDHTDLLREDRLPAPGDIFTGLALGVLIPTLTEGLKRKLRFFHRPIMWPIKKVVFFFAERMGNLINRVSEERIQEFKNASDLNAKLKLVNGYVETARATVQDYGPPAASAAALPLTLVATTLLIIFTGLYITIYRIATMVQ